MKSFSDFNIKPDFPLTGNKESIHNLYNKPIEIMDFKVIQVTDEKTGELTDSLQIQFRYPDESIDRIVFTRSKIVRGQLNKIDKKELPFVCTFRTKGKSTYIQ